MQVLFMSAHRRFLLSFVHLIQGEDSNQQYDLEFGTRLGMVGAEVRLCGELWGKSTRTSGSLDKQLS